MQLDFLTPRVDLLNSEGRVETVHPGGGLGRLRRPVLLLGRSLCAFALFDASNLPRNRRQQAARLYARTGSPYVVSSATLVKSGSGYGVWWWDLDRIAPTIAEVYAGHSPLVRPETMAQPATVGWRIVKLAEGYEAQLWSLSGLLASVWRRNRFDQASWASFTRLQRGDFQAPEAPPPAVSLPIATDSEAFSLARAEVSREQAIAGAAGGFSVAAACAVLFLLGQGSMLGGEARTISKEAIEIRQSTPRIADTQALQEDQKKLVAYRQLEEQTNPVSAAGAAVGIVAFHDLTPISLDASGETLTLSLPYSAVDDAEMLVTDFEGSGYFYDVRPRTDAANQRLIFEMKVREAAPPLTAGD